MKKFVIIFAYMRGISVSHEMDIKTAACHIKVYDGWKSIRALRLAIKKWGAEARPGQTFKTACSVLICVSEEKEKSVLDSIKLIYDNEYWCPKCNIVVGHDNYRYSHGQAYHIGCGEDLQTSHIIKPHYEILEKIINDLSGS